MSGNDVTEFVVRKPPRNSKKTHHVMKFNASLNVDFSKWNQGTVRMARENNQKLIKAATMNPNSEEAPKFGAGSEFGREQKEEARRKKLGIISKKYRPQDQPWLIRVGDKKTGKKYRGIREGGVSDNTSYYVFTHAPDGAFEAHPVEDWYNFTPILTYKTLNAEEAEEKFAERGKILNHWALMVNKKFRSNVEDDGNLDEDGKPSKKSSSKEGPRFKISDMDDWVNSDDELDSDDEDKKKKKKDSDDEDGGGKKSKSKDARKKKKKTKEDVQDEAFEDSDDGDDECREVDYMSDESSDSEMEAMEKAETKGVDQDKALSKMLDSEESSEEDEDGKKKEDEEKEESGNEGESGKKGKKKKKDKSNSARSSRSPSPNTENSGSSKAEKRKAMVDNLLDPNAGPSEPPTKKNRLDQFSSGSQSIPIPLTGSEAALEDDVRRYLMRKPMTTTELFKKIHSKRFQNFSKEELMPLLGNVLKKINPHKTKTKGIMYLSLEPGK